MKHLLCSMIAAAIIATAPTISSAHEIKAGDLLITGMWSRATPGGASVAGGYLTIANKGAAADRLVSAASPSSGKTDLHEMATTNGVMTMRPIEGGLVIPAAKTVTLAPGGLHLMLTELKQPLKEGELLPITLQFEKAGKVDVTLHVRAVGAPATTAGHDAHSPNKM